MKTNIITLTLLSLMSLNFMFAQDRTTVTANNSEISDNLDLRAVASIFGDSKNLDDFENRLNNPEYQISNLDLNNDNKVDYLRVIETVESNEHLIIIQSVIGRDLFQDIATVEITKDRNNQVQVQVVGDVYMYGANYIYEPVYAYTPVIYTSFWAPRYTPYYSSWYWGYYPSYYVAWNPFPIFRYRNNINIWINYNHQYNYVNTRNCYAVYNNYYRGRRGNAYETQHPNRSFTDRHNGYTNRYELDKTRNIRTVGTRNEVASNNTRNTKNGLNTTRTSNNSNSVRNNSISNSETVRENNSNGNTRSFNSSSSVKSETPVRNFAQNNSVRDVVPTRSNTSIKNAPTRNSNSSQSVKNEPTRSLNNTSIRNNSSSTRSNSSPRKVSNGSSSRSNNSESSSRGTSRR